MVHITGEIVIIRPVEAVFDFVADMRNEPRYNTQMLRVEQTSAGPIGEGTRFWAESISMGLTAEMTIEYTAFEYPYGLSSRTQMATMDIRGTLAFERIPEGTRMQWSWELKPRGVLKLLAPLFAIMGQRQEQAIWGGLKRLLEEQETSSLET